MSNGNGTYMALRDATGIELTDRIAVPYQDPPMQVSFTVLVTGVPAEAAFFDSNGNLLWTIPHSNPRLHPLNAGDVISFMGPPPQFSLS